MKILIIGAGVVGSIYAARLHWAGEQVSLLARGQRLAELRENAVVLEDEGTGQRTTTPVPLIDHLDPDDEYDLVMVIMRKDQVPWVLPMVAESRCTPNVLFVGNNVAGPEEYTRALGPERVLLGFAGSGGRREGNQVRFVGGMGGSRPRITIGETDGGMSLRVQEIARTLEHAGFRVDISSDIDAWLKTHWAVVGPIAGALYLAGGDNYRLARTRDGIVLLIRAMREGFQVLRKLGIPLLPRGAQLYEWLPEPLLVALFSRLAATRSAEIALAAHANAARDEMQVLTDEFRTLVRASGLSTPALDRLYPYFNPAAPPLREGSKQIPLDWRGAMMYGAAIGLLLLLLFKPSRRR